MTRQYESVSSSQPARKPTSASLPTSARSSSSSRSHSRACGVTSRSQNARAVSRTSSCSGVSVKSMEEQTGAGLRRPPSSLGLAALDQRAELRPRAVVVTDELHLRDRETILPAGLHRDA